MERKATSVLLCFLVMVAFVVESEGYLGTVVHRFVQKCSQMNSAGKRWGWWPPIGEVRIAHTADTLPRFDSYYALS